MADSPTSVTPQSNPVISDPAMDTNQIYEHESERPQQVSPDSNIQLAQNDVYLGGRQLNNPNGVEVRGSEDEPTPPAVEHGNTFHDQDSADLAERGQPRDIGNWSNGQADEILNRPAVQRQMDAEQRSKTQAMLRTVSKDTHDIVQMPSGHTVAIPKNLPEAKKQSIVKGLWSELTDVSNSVKNAASNAAQALGLPGDMPEWQAKTDDFMRDPIGEAGNAVGTLLHGLNTQIEQLAPLSDENKALVQRANDQYKQGNALAAAVTLVPLVGDNLAKAVVQAKKHDFSGSLGTAVGTALPFLTGAEEEPLPVTKEKPTVPTTTRYAHTPAQNGQFGNLEHAVTTKDLQGNVVGHLAAQDTAPGEVTVRSNQIYNEAHQGQGKGTSQLRTLVNETAKDPAIKTIYSDISTTGAARGAWDKLAMEHPDIVTKENVKGTPRYSVNLDKVRENAANAPEFNGVERRGTARSAPMGATDLEQAMKNPGQRIQTPFDVTEGAMDTINKDINKRLEPLEGPKPPKARAASAPTQSVGAASINDLNTKEDVPPFYSKAEQVIGEKVSNMASGDQVKAVLKNNGVKEDEMKWSGLDDFLSGKSKVSKSDLQQYIAEHKMSIQDVDLGEAAPTPEMEKELHDQVMRNGELYSIGDDRTPAQESEYQQGVSRAQELEKQFVRRPTQYEKYTVPGEKSNYREKLLTLPSTTPGAVPERTAFNDYQNQLLKKHGEQPNTFTDGAVQDRMRSLMTPDEMVEGRRLSNAARDAEENAKNSDDYVAPHFQQGGAQPNIVAHVRYSDRPAVNGQKTLFMEEAQSDWHSAGRHEGYQGDPKEISKADDVFRAAQDAKNAHVQSVLDRVNKLRVDANDQVKKDFDLIHPLQQDMTAPLSRALHDAMTTEEKSKYSDLLNKINDARAAKNALKQGAVPDAPFKQNWHELVMKRMLRHAAENGYDQLAWTTGQQQADLYGLEHHFSKLEYDPESGELNGYDPQGKIVVNENVDSNSEALSDYMPAELAEKLADKIQDYKDNATGEPDADQLYDHISQQYGVEEIEPQEEGDEPKWSVTNEYGDPDGPFDSQDEAEQFLHQRIRDEVQSELEDYEAEKPKLPALEGLDLHHGGEFHKLLYDKMIPSFLKKYAKKWGAEVGTTDIKGMGEPKIDYEGKDVPIDRLERIRTGESLAIDGTGKGDWSYSARERLNDVIKDMRRGIPFQDAMKAVAAHGADAELLAEHLGGKIKKSGSKDTVHSIPITEEMRKSVMKQGQPIAKSEQPDRKKIFGQLGSALA